MSVGLVHLAVVALTRSLGPLEGARALGIVYFLMALLVLAVTFHHAKNGFVSTRMGRVYVGLIAASFTYGEPPRLLRRLFSLRGLSYEEVEQVLARSP
ncbi:hypothetical protein [Diaphorobacter caeni]|uniref:hypothetical protein n=1 Tax=Diaphorobacter caeni TaxID=2784387 RepID=UPI00188F03DC|nr:hypothetical protein [Diaphorobacter caeni]MBF5007862.1 hypothetical protein [Diaphorobacter caeni]